MNRSTELVQYELRDRCAWIFLNRPERLNAVVPEMVDQLCHALSRASIDRVTASVIAGRGRAFCSGFDLKYERQALTESEHRRQVERTHDVTRLIRRADFPVLTAVHGYALGHGCEFALAGDIVILANDSVLGFPETTWGLGVTGGVSDLLVRAVGQYRAKRLLFLGEQFRGQEAEAWGLAAEAVPAEELLSRTAELVLTLQSRPQLAILRAKRAIDIAMGGPLEVAFAIETEHALHAARDGASEQAILSYRRSRADSHLVGD